MIGTIKKIDLTKGFGFIRDESGKEYFFHRSAVPRDIGFDSMEEGERVAFDEEDGPKGPRASNVQRA